MIDFQELVSVVLEAKVYPNPKGVILDASGNPVSSKPKRIRKKPTSTPKTTTPKRTPKPKTTTPTTPPPVTTPAPAATHHTPPERMLNSILGHPDCKTAIVEVFNKSTPIIKRDRGIFKYTDNVILDNQTDQLKALEEMLVACHQASQFTNTSSEIFGKYSEYIAVAEALTQAFDAAADKRYGTANDKKTNAFGIDKTGDNIMTNGTFVKICQKISDKLDLLFTTTKNGIETYQPSHTTISNMWRRYKIAIKKTPNQSKFSRFMSGINRAVGSFQPNLSDITKL